MSLWTATGINEQNSLRFNDIDACLLVVDKVDGFSRCALCQRMVRLYHPAESKHRDKEATTSPHDSRRHSHVAAVSESTTPLNETHVSLQSGTIEGLSRRI